MADFDWDKKCAGDADQKEAWHRAAKRQLTSFARDMGFAAGTFSVRSNKAGSAVSGEVTLHHDDIYIQVSQPSFSKTNDRGMMLRTVKNQQDYHGGQNHFAPLTYLDDASRGKLRKLATQIIEQKHGFNADLVDDIGYNPHLSTPRYSK